MFEMNKILCTKSIRYFFLESNDKSTYCWPIIKEFKKHTRAYSIAKSKYNVELSKNVKLSIIDQKYKPRKHPGVLKINCVQLPDLLINAVNEVIKGYPKKLLYEHAVTLSNYLHSRFPPAEGVEIKDKRDFIKDKLFIEGNLPSLQINPTLSDDSFSKDERRKLDKALKNAIYNWKPIEYNDYICVAYLVARLAPDFACLVKIFEEIKKRNTNFHPKTFFDFGSGVGSGIWALNHVWPNICTEAYFVDSSPSMNNLAERLLKGGDPNGNSVGPRSTYFRQFLPASSALQYDIVLSSRSMYEMGDLKSRATTSDILWRKVAPGGFLVFVENSTNPSYKVLMELRDFLLQMNASHRKRNSNTSPMHVFAPCPHDQFCPRFFHISGQSCHFNVKYQPPQETRAKTELFSYFVLQKAERPESCWPRVVQPVLERHNHVILRTCTPAAEIQGLVVTRKKPDSECYHICKNTSWGDLLPVELLPKNENKASESAIIQKEDDNETHTEPMQEHLDYIKESSTTN